MGVKNLKKFIREKYPSEIQQMNMSNFYGQIFMMDIISYIYKFKVSMKDKWLQSIINLFKVFKSNNVHVNIVFEGKSPIEKNKEKEERKKQRKQQEQQIKNIKNDLCEYYKTGTITQLLKDIYTKINQSSIQGNCVQNFEKINRLLHFNSNSNSNLNETIENDDLNTSYSSNNSLNSDTYILQPFDDKTLVQFEEYIDKKESQLIVITEQDTNKIKELCDVFGVPYFQSENEAETLCCQMCKNVKENEGEIKSKKAIGVISEDSDVLAYGSDMLICDLNISNGDCNVIYLPSLLHKMELTQREFLEFCVLSGTDYNSNIPGIGSVKCIELIKKYKSISHIFNNEKIMIEKKINDMIKKRANVKKSDYILECQGTLSRQYSYKNENIDNESEQIEYNIITSKQLFEDMMRSIELFSPSNSNYKSKFWNPNVDFNKLYENCLIYHINYNSVEKLWMNNIELI